MPNDGGLTTAEHDTLEALLRKLSATPGADLPWSLFRFINEVVATPNIDLLVRDDAGRTLLAWRDDPFGSGWHVPGSIIRHREEIAHRIAACAGDEFGCAVTVSARAIALVQIFDDRGHSVSLCYPARLASEPGRRLIGAGDTPAPGDLRWFDAPPDALYPSHECYREIIARCAAGTLGPGVGLFTQHTGARDARASQSGASPAGTISAVSLD